MPRGGINLLDYSNFTISFLFIFLHFRCPIFLQRHHIRERSLSVVNMFLDEMAKEAKNIITTICDEQCTLSDKVILI